MPDPAKLPAATIAAGQFLYRIHGAGRSARWYGRRDGTWRWDDPAHGYGVLYLGRDRSGPFAETLLRTPADRHVLWSLVAQKRWARFRVLRTLRLANLRGDGLAWFGRTLAEIAADADPVTNPAAYAVPQEVSASVQATTDLDGVLCVSRFNPSAACVALFERADSAVELVEEDIAIEKAWVKRLLDRQGYTLIDL